MIDLIKKWNDAEKKAHDRLISSQGSGNKKGRGNDN